MKRLLFLVNILLVVALLVACIAPFVAPRFSYIPQLLGLFYSYLLLGNILFLLMWLFVRRRYAKYSFPVLLISLFFLPRFYQWGSGKDLTYQEKRFKLLSYNVRKFTPQSKEISPVELFEFVKTEAPSVVCFQEYSQSRYLKYGKKLLGGNYSFIHREGEIATFSKFPIINKQHINFNRKEYAKGVFSDIVVHQDTLRVLNVHLESNQLSPDNKEEIASFIHKKGRNIRRLSSVYSKLKRASLHRSTQVEELLELIKKSPYPVVLCGDFNDIPLSYSYQRIKSLLNDGFMEGGSGKGISFSEGLIQVRIDYIFSKLKMCNHRIYDVNYSDHKPLIIYLQRTKNLE